jgi:cell division protein FtsL
MYRIQLAALGTHKRLPRLLGGAFVMDFLPTAHQVLLLLIFAALLLSALGVVISELGRLFALLPWLIG